MAGKSKKSNTHSYIGWGIGLGVTAATAASAYFLYGTKEGKKQRTKMKGWMLKMKGEVLEKMEKAKDLNEKKYQEIINTVMGKYKKLKTLNNKEVQAIGDDLKKHWKNIQKHLKETEKKGSTKKTTTKKKPAAKKKTTTKKKPVAKKKTTRSKK